MKRKKFLNWGVVFIVTCVLLEVALRLQQYFGPIYDLNFDDITLDGLSNVVNHKPLRKSFSKLSGISMYQDFDGYEYTTYYDSNGIRENRLRPKSLKNDKNLRILFMGDSFMQGYDDKNTIPQHVWSYLKEKGLIVNILNAGFLSYSPAIYIPQSKILIPRLKPEFVVVDIDETDLGDDFIRYKELIARDQNGKITAVKPTPIYYEQIRGLLTIKNQPAYISRLLQAIYHTKIYMPAIIKQYRKNGKKVLDFSKDHDDNAHEKYHQEIAFFRNNVSELIITLIDLMGDRSKILFLYHPHLQHLKPDSDGRYWNLFVSTTVKEAAETYGIAFYDASDDLRVLFKGKPQEFYWNKNIHFNFKGLKLYGELVAKRLFTLINPP